MKRWWDDQNDRPVSVVLDVSQKSKGWKLRRQLRRRLAGRWLDALGAPDTWRGRGPRHIGLCYHSVAVPDEALEVYDPNLAVSASHFACQMDLVARWFPVVTATTLEKRLGEGASETTFAAVTFDDGLRSVHDVAKPILKAAGLRATLFVNDGVFAGGRLWHDRVARAAQRLERRQIAAILSRGPSGSGSLAVQTVAALKHLDKPGLGRAMARLEEAAGLPRGGGEVGARIYNTEREVVAWAEEGHEVGGHTSTHLILPRITARQQSEEVRGNLDVLGRLLGKSITSFAYPNGYHDPAVRRLMRGSGIKVAFEVEGYSGHGGPWARRRRNISDEVCSDEHGRFSPALFLGWILGPGQWQDRPSR